jgi:hypothetical protein
LTEFLFCSIDSEVLLFKLGVDFDAAPLPQLARSVSCVQYARSVPRWRCLLSNSSAFAGDYSLTYAIDANGKHDAGRIDICQYDDPCDIEPAGLELSISISLSIGRPNYKWAELRVKGPRGCCYSYDAREKFFLEIKPGLLRVPMYQGRSRRENEFVQNRKFGILYLEFSNLR